ncbi:MAG: YceI family protein [Planctomycetota bacterium]|jgi:polyisoprenoid-binding protein YceI
MRSLGSTIAACVIALVSAAVGVRADEQSYAVVPEQSHFQIKTGTGGVFGGLAHEHVVVAREFVGTIIYDPADPSKSSVTITVQTEKLEIADKDVSDSDRKKITKSMKETVLEVSKHPTVVFTSTRCTPSMGGLEVIGDLTIKGVTKEAGFYPVVELLEDGALRVRGGFSFKQTTFGIKPYSAGLGSIKVKDEVSLTFEAVAAEVKGTGKKD